MVLFFQDTKISEDNILSDIMSDLDGNPSSVAVKPKPLIVSKTNNVDSSKTDAQNYFKSLSSVVKKTSSVFGKQQSSDVKEVEPVGTVSFTWLFFISHSE